MCVTCALEVGPCDTWTPSLKSLRKFLPSSTVTLTHMLPIPSQLEGLGSPVSSAFKMCANSSQFQHLCPSAPNPTQSLSPELREKPLEGHKIPVTLVGQPHLPPNTDPSTRLLKVPPWFSHTQNKFHRLGDELSGSPGICLFLQPSCHKTSFGFLSFHF